MTILLNLYFALSLFVITCFAIARGVTDPHHKRLCNIANAVAVLFAVIIASLVTILAGSITY